MMQCFLRMGVIAWTLGLPMNAFAKPLVLWHSYRGSEEKALEKVVERFEQRYPEETLKVLAVPYDVMASKLTAAIPRGNGPDVFIFAHERIGGWVQSGLLEPWANGAFERDAYFSKTVEALSLGQEVYGLPLAFKSLALFYNKDLVPRAPSTTAELVSLAQSLYAPGHYAMAYQSESFYFHTPWLLGMGGTLFDSRERATFRSQPALEAYAFVKGLRDKNYIPDEASGSLVKTLFNTGKAAMVMSGPWFSAEIAPTIDYGVAPLPLMPTGRRAQPLLTVEGVFVSSHSAWPGKGQRLAKFLAGETGSTIRALVGGQTVAYQSVWDSAKLRSNPVQRAFLEQLRFTLPMPSDGSMHELWEPGDLGLRKLLRAGYEPEVAAESAWRRYQAITRPAPTPKDPSMYLAFFILFGLLLLGWLIQQMVRVVKSAQLGDLLSAARWVGPALIATIVLVFLPFAFAVGLGFFSHRLGDWTFVGFGNFQNILGTSVFSPLEPLSFYFALAVTVLWTAINLFLHVGFGVGLALLLNRKGLRLRGFYRVLLVLPWAVPNYITALIWKGLFHRQFGAINQLLEWFGLEAVAWFSSFGTAFFANICTNAWLGFPFMMVVSLGALQAIPGELYEAAKVDGAGAWHQFKSITLPLLVPALGPAVILGIIWTFNQFNIVYLVSGGEPDNATDILISEAYRWAFTRQEQYGYAGAYATLIFLLLLGWSLWSARFQRRFRTTA